MTEEEVKETDRESKETGVAKNRTFAAKWLSQAYKLVLILIGFSATVVAAQIALFVFFPDKDLVIPGQSVIHSFTGASATALVGGEKIAGKLKKNGTVNL